jgi:hypothetical protein
LKKGEKKMDKQIILILVFLMVGLSSSCALGQKGTGQTKSKPKTQTAQNEEKEEPTLIGKWTSSEAKVEFLDESRMTINGDKFNYAVVGKLIIIENEEGQMEFPFTLKGDTLTVTFEGRKIVYTRVGKDEETAEEVQPQRNQRGSNPQELVGKWCYQANVQAQGGGRQTDICFTLNANGTYEYYGESTSTNPNGGANSQSSDSGRWSATATTLTARSNSGETKTYTLEKRNHPKTGDPMLMVDGDAFVTFYQKQPW